MKKFAKFKKWLLLPLPVLVLSLGACTPAASTETAAPAVITQLVEVTRIVEQTVVVEQVVEKVVTATPEPATPEPTQAVQAVQAGGPTATSTGAPFVNAFQAWCLPEIKKEDLTSLKADGTMQPDAKRIMLVDGKPTLIIESLYCAFTYDFGSPAPKGVKLKIHDLANYPFIDTEMTPTTNNPNIVYAVVRQPYVIDPPFWSIEYKTTVSTAEGQEVSNQAIIYKRGWIPKLCYAGEWPEPANLKCRDWGEAHPWDPWYGYDQPYDGIGDNP